MKFTRPLDLKQLEENARDLGRRMLLFDFGEGGNLTWISNAQREDMLKALHELIGKLEQLGAPHQGGRQ